MPYAMTILTTENFIGQQPVCTIAALSKSDPSKWNSLVVNQFMTPKAQDGLLVRLQRALWAVPDPGYGKPAQ